MAKKQFHENLYGKTYCKKPLYKLFMFSLSSPGGGSPSGTTNSPLERGKWPVN